jgi:hypothetical protein
MAVSDCIRQFAGSLDVERMQTLARAFEEKGMSPDTAIVRVAAEERVRLQNEFNSLLDMAGVRKAEPEAPKAETEPPTYDNMAARQVAEANPEMRVMDENGNSVSATEALAKVADMERIATEDGYLHKVAISCALTNGT